MIQLFHGDCLQELWKIPDGSVDAIITDPPYSSGGLTKADRSKPPSQKYINADQLTNYVDFSGDTLDQRSWTNWMIMWLSLALCKVKPGGYVCCFTDWRQLPASSDVLQMSGVIWRGIAVWDKGPASRSPHKGYFRHQAEYVIWGSNGSLPAAKHDGPYPGVIKAPVNPKEKLHMTGKPLPLMNELIRIVPEGGTILDPFMGSATTGVACKDNNRNFIGIEKNDHYYRVACKRLGIAS